MISKCPKRPRGFSLIELGIVIAAMAVLASIVLMGSGYLNAAKSRNAVEMVSTLRQAAKQFAMRNNNGLFFFNPSASNPEETKLKLQNLAKEGLVKGDIVSPWDKGVAIEPTDTPANPCGGFTCMRICMVTPDEADCTTCKDLIEPFRKIAAVTPSCGGNGCGLGGQCVFVLVSR